MNEKERRRLQNFSQPRPQYSVGAPSQNLDGPVQISQGHDGDLQYIVLSRPATHVGLNEQQVDDFIKNMLDVKARLKAAKAQGGDNPGNHPPKAS